MNTEKMPVAVFRLGHIVATANARESISPDEILQGIQRHQAGDWGNLPDDDRSSNDRALAQGGRLVSRYHAQNGTKFYVITESDRSLTTVLLPEDY